ncbi:AraC family ligand binding domain-containing protein [Bradyrhizobium sp. OAE829]|uniref:AraC family ligand binding domain-containing protein n=1 Tax=Bradyrhizobium sp. OAE829 TaxID=2663807 RepID=UPI0033978594
MGYPFHPFKSVKLHLKADNRIMMFLSSASEAPLVSIVREGKQVDGPIHQHLEGQLIYPQLGVLILELDNKVIRLAPDRAAWIPSNVLHSVILNQTYRYHSVYVDPAFFHGPSAQILQVRPLFRELILDAESWFRDPDRRAADRDRAKILMDEMQHAVHLNRAVEIPRRTPPKSNLPRYRSEPRRQTFLDNLVTGRRCQ